ncbi:MAG: hypothetical protein DBY45_01265 [Clostridiales bacterium]|nr:MAG: hypothetical protein DBY45_01265 [Clostridiales bacterium]
MKKTKILMGIIGKGNGGLSTYAVNLFRKLDSDVFDCTFLSNDPHPYFEKDIKELGGHLKVIAARNRHPKQHRDDLRRIMAEEQFDVCHIHLSSDSNICPLVEAKRARIPIVIAHCHSAKVEGSLYPKVLHRLNKPKVQKMDIIRLACSKAAGEFAYGDAPFTVANNGIDLKKFDFDYQIREKTRKDIGVSDRFVIGQLGRLVPVKNHEFSLKVFAEVLKRHSRSSFLIVGGGPLEQSLKEKVSELGIEDKVIFTGNVRNPQDYLNAMDCMMLPSLFEGFPLTIVEAVCSGLPCFISDTVTREVEISDLVQFISLGEGPESVAKKVLKAKDIERTSQAELLKALHYDSDELVKDMERCYLNQMTGGE